MSNENIKCKKEQKKAFKCAFCDKEFPSKANLKNHELTHTKCELCHKEFKDLKRHMRIHNGEVQRFTCKICGKSVTNLSTHMIIHGHTRPKCLECKTCGKTFPRNETLWLHIQNLHSERKPFKCEVCGKEFIFSHKMKLHVRVAHNGEKPFKCEFCNKKFAAQGTLSLHRRKIHTEEKPFSCDVCERRFVTSFELIKHTQTHTLPFKCKICGKGLASKPSLYTHEQSHTKTKSFNFKCDQCGTGFYSLKSFSDHRKHEHGDTKPFKCETCGKGLRSLNGLTNHLRTHDGSRPFDCDEVFERRAGICRHYKELHPGKPILLPNIELFKCDQCDMVYTQALALQIHETKHHGRRSANKKFCEDCKLEYVDVHKCRKETEANNGTGTFPCKFCGQIFKWRASMFRHEKNVHGEEKFNCEVCNKKFVTGYMLAHHTKYSHTPVNCDVCGKTIRSEYDLKRHKAFMHHDDSAWFCPTCPKKKVFFSKEQYDRHMAKSHALP